MPISHADKNILLSGIGTEIRRRREKLGLSQAILAGNAGVHLNVIGRVERGTYNPTALVLRSIAGALGTTMVKLL
jgi:transcriptional regulator with XRE-family HTH domain